MIRRLCITALFVALSGCSNPIRPGMGTEVRFSNVSSHDFLDFTYQSGGEALYFDRISRGTTTEYRPIDRSYRYGFVELFVGERRFVLQPIDYVGEEPLSDGRFTFRVSLDTASAFGVGLELNGG